MHDSSNCPICRGLAISGSLSDEEFLAFVRDCQDELSGKQARFQERIAGFTRWHYDMADGSLLLGETRFGMTVIGSYSPRYESWLWGWANEEFPETARADSRRIQGLGDVTGFQVFQDPGLSASVDDAEVFTALAIHQLSAIGRFRCPGEESELFFAVHESSSGPTADASA